MLSLELESGDSTCAPPDAPFKEMQHRCIVWRLDELCSNALGQELSLDHLHSLRDE